MANYYCLMAGAPDVELATEKERTITLDEFRSQCEEVLTNRDAKLLFYFFLKQDCLNLVKLLKNPDAEIAVLGNFSTDQFHDLISSAQSMNFNVHRFPAFMSDFARQYNYNNEKEGWFAEDQIMLAFYEYAKNCPNKFIASWYALEMDVNNILTALIARRNGWNVADYILGDGEVNEMIRTNNSKDFDLSLEYDYVADLMKIAEETDPVEKERRIDAMKWTWLDDSVTDIFSIEAVFAYMCKLQMIDRWERLDPENGKARFRQIIENLRAGAKVPAEFVR